MRPDVVIVGAGIQGTTMAAEASRRGLDVVLVDRARPAAGATPNSYGIVHGGLRYLQSLDVQRWRRSRRAQAWFVDGYPAFVRPLPCLMPLYKGALRSPAAFRFAIAMERTLASSFGPDLNLPRTELVGLDSLDETPVPREGLTGVARWTDAEITSCEALLRAIIEKAGPGKITTLAPFDACEVVERAGRVVALRGRDGPSGTIEIEAETVIDCAGSWAGAWSGLWSGVAGRPSAAALAFNLIFDRPMQDGPALAVSPDPGRGRSYFVRPRDGRIFAGTYYVASPGQREAVVSEENIEAFRRELDAALPSLGLRDAPILSVMAGLLPDKDGSGNKLNSRDHLVSSPVKGLHLVVGGKLTTAPLLSAEAAARIWPRRDRRVLPRLRKGDRRG